MTGLCCHAISQPWGAQCRKAVLLRQHIQAKHTKQIHSSTGLTHWVEASCISCCYGRIQRLSVWTLPQQYNFACATVILPGGVCDVGSSSCACVHRQLSLLHLVQCWYTQTMQRLWQSGECRLLRFEKAVENTTTRRCLEAGDT